MSTEQKQTSQIPAQCPSPPFIVIPTSKLQSSYSSFTCITPGQIKNFGIYNNGTNPEMEYGKKPDEYRCLILRNIVWTLKSKI